MLTLAMITEVVFNWPGIGRWLINAIRQQDYAAISAGVMVVGSLVIVVNVFSDILGALMNPLKHKEWYALTITYTAKNRCPARCARRGGFSIATHCR